VRTGGVLWPLTALSHSRRHPAVHATEVMRQVTDGPVAAVLDWRPEPVDTTAQYGRIPIELASQMPKVLFGVHECLSSIAG